MSVGIDENLQVKSPPHHVCHSLVYPHVRLAYLWSSLAGEFCLFFREGWVDGLWWHVELEASYRSYSKRGRGLENIGLRVAGVDIVLLWWHVKHVCLIVNDPKMHPRAARKPARACRIHPGCFVRSCRTKAVYNIWWAMCGGTRLSITRQYCLRAGWFSSYCILAEVAKVPWGWVSYFYNL